MLRNKNDCIDIPLNKLNTSLIKKWESAREKKNNPAGDYNPSRLALGSSEWQEAI